MENEELHSKKDGKRLIIHSLRTPKSLKEIYQDLQKKDEKKKPLSKSTILYHLDKLVKQEFVKSDEQKRYVLIVSEDHQNAILDALRKSRTVDELANFFKKKSAKKQKNNDLEKLEDLDYLRELLEFFYDQELLTRSTNRALYNPKEEWHITWLACSKINACMVCKNYFDPNDTTAIAETIQSNFHPEEGNYTSTVLIHNKCFHRLKDSPEEQNSDFCDFCGLPLSKKRLMEWVHREDAYSILHLIRKSFTQNENYVFHKWIRHEAKNQFEKQFSIKINEGDIVISDSKNSHPIYVQLDKNQANKLLAKFPGYRYQFRDYDFVTQGRFKFHIFLDIITKLDNPSIASLSTFFNDMRIYASSIDVMIPTSESLPTQMMSWSDRKGEDIFSEIEIQRKVHERIISNLISDKLNQIFSQMQPETSNYKYYPRIWDMGLKRTYPAAYEESATSEESFLEDSLINIKNGKRYHPYCFEKINNSSTLSEEKVN